MGVSENSGTPKSSILIGFSIINHPFWGTPIFGNTHIYIYLHRFVPLLTLLFVARKVVETIDHMDCWDWTAGTWRYRCVSEKIVLYRSFLFRGSQGWIYFLILNWKPRNGIFKMTWYNPAFQWKVKSVFWCSPLPTVTNPADLAKKTRSISMWFSMISRWEFWRPRAWSSPEFSGLVSLWISRSAEC